MGSQCSHLFFEKMFDKNRNKILQKYKRYDIVRPTKKQKTEINAEVRITERNLRHTRMEINAGKMIKAEINKAPIIRIPKTMVIAVSNAISIL